MFGGCFGGEGILEGVTGLNQRQVALYLLRKAGHGCRVLYYLRSTPMDLIKDFVKEFDENLRSTLKQCLMSLMASQKLTLPCFKNYSVSSHCPCRLTSKAILLV